MKRAFLLSIIALLLASASLVAWWLIPNTESLAWVRMSLLVLSVLMPTLVLLIGFMTRPKSEESIQKHDQQVLLEQDTKAIRDIFSASTKKIRGDGKRKLSSMYALPWYLLVGRQNSAKSALLRQNNLEPVLDVQLNENDAEQYLRFWSNDHLVVIEVGHRVFDHDGIDSDLWKVVGQQLLKYRPRQGLNGVITVVEANRLIEADKKEKQALAVTLQDAILSLAEKLGIDLPVYSVFTKADAIADFIPFFESFSGRDVDNPFGITLSNDDTHRFDPLQFDEKVKLLLKELVKQQMTLLRNVTNEQTDSVIALPYQLRVFFEQARSLMADVGRENRVRSAVWIRGIYLVSSAQSGKELDLLTQAIAEKAEFNTLSRKEQLPGRRGYFAARLFSDVLLPEYRITAMNPYRQTRYLLSRTGMVAVALLFVLGVSAVVKQSWDHDEAWRAEAQTQLSLYKNDIERLEKEPHTIIDTITVLNELRVVAKAGIAPTPWYEKVSVNQQATADEVYRIYEEQLHLFLLPRVEELVSNELYVYVSLGNPTRIFEILRYYKMLFNEKQLDKEALISYLLNNLEDQGEASVQDVQTLSLLLDDLLSSQYDHAIKPNKELISVASSNLEGLSPERLIYARLKSLPEYRTQVDIRRQLGDKFDVLFEFSDGFHGYVMPEVFTKQGYENLDLSATSPVLKQQYQEFRAIQGDMSSVSLSEMTNLSKQIQRLYFSDYIYRWQDILTNIKVKSFSSTTDLSYTLRMSREPSSGPMLDLLDAIVINTTLANEETADTAGAQKTAQALGLGKVAKAAKTANKVNNLAGDKLLKLQPAYVVNEAFAGYNVYMRGLGGAGSPLPIDQLIAQFDSLNTYFDTALTSPDPGKVMMDYAVAHAQGSQDALVMFGRESSKAPGQIAGWIKSVERQAWQQVIRSSAGYLNKQWEERVYLFYVATVEGRFPFSLQGRGEVAIDDFANFFKPQGKVDSFIDQMLMPFVYWDNGILKLREIDGQVMPISTNTRAQLKKARNISELFFGKAGQELALQVSIRPSSMSTDVTEFQMREVENVFSYRHGPRVWSNVAWPSIGLDGYLSTSFYEGDNRVATRNYAGEWALFRAIFDGDSSATSDRRINKLKYELDTHKIVLDYTLLDSSIALNKDLFTQFTLPRRL
ncbi:type VI secretion system membrane subunit TssM [Enterovibrio sp. ZSDZ35]|uniref:Type VI secretion system membrane subunit TssM n=1 Tax=Enterovibrio qingdaonensis TaxID=2899818 RepID=A0ABT5QSK9_9GAMM|nr:type VI secretion system membrane subunit TssM [Enterovibrio sp. ZSDZ35]MDD1783966.1 type VI secretion system membrane subunit TssM [Enterovibrio sp. ZSDZ35]